MLICTSKEDIGRSRFALLIDIRVGDTGRAATTRHLEDYLQQLRQLFAEDSGYLGAELHSRDDGHLLGYLNWRRREDWEVAWDCHGTQSDLFADSLLRLGARSIRFDSVLIAG